MLAIGRARTERQREYRRRFKVGHFPQINAFGTTGIHGDMIRKLKSGEFRSYSRKKDEATGKRRNLGTFSSLEKAKQHEREVQYFKKH